MIPLHLSESLPVGPTRTCYRPFRESMCPTPSHIAATSAAQLNRPIRASSQRPAPRPQPAPESVRHAFSTVRCNPLNPNHLRARRNPLDSRTVRHASASPGPPKPPTPLCHHEIHTPDRHRSFENLRGNVIVSAGHIIPAAFAHPLPRKARRPHGEKRDRRQTTPSASACRRPVRPGLWGSH